MTESIRTQAALLNGSWKPSKLLPLGPCEKSYDATLDPALFEENNLAVCLRAFKLRVGYCIERMFGAGPLPPNPQILPDARQHLNVESPCVGSMNELLPPFLDL